MEQTNASAHDLRSSPAPTPTPSRLSNTLPPRFVTLSGEAVYANLENGGTISDARRALGLAMGVASNCIQVMSGSACMLNDSRLLAEFGGQDLVALVAQHEPVRVVARLRPQFGKEYAEGRETIVDMDCKSGVVFLRPPGTSRRPVQEFQLDAAFDGAVSQRDLFRDLAPDMLEHVKEGGNAAFVVYGQNYTGKTHTMQGYGDDEELRGLVPRALEYIFRDLATGLAGNQVTVRMSYLEVHNEEVRDLLSSNPKERLTLNEHAFDEFCVQHLNPVVAKSLTEALSIVYCGQANRSVGATNMSTAALLGHAILSVSVEQILPCADGRQEVKVGQLIMVDLAASERRSKTGATGEMLKESRINPMTGLWDVVDTLVCGAPETIPYHKSKLARLLRDPFGGNCKTVFIANVGPADFMYDETLATLRFARKVRDVKNTPRLNVEFWPVTENSVVRTSEQGLASSI